MLKGKNIVWFVVGGVVLLILLRRQADADALDHLSGVGPGPVYSRFPPQVTGLPHLSPPEPLTASEKRDILAAPKTRTGAGAF